MNWATWATHSADCSSVIKKSELRTQVGAAKGSHGTQLSLDLEERPQIVVERAFSTLRTLAFTLCCSKEEYIPSTGIIGKGIYRQSSPLLSGFGGVPFPPAMRGATSIALRGGRGGRGTSIIMTLFPNCSVSFGLR